jgi:hypothetical protein
MKLGAILRSTVAAICILGVATPTMSISAAPRHVSKPAKHKPAPRKAAAPRPAAAASAGLQVRVAQAPISRGWSSPVRAACRPVARERPWCCAFPRDANPNLSPLNVGPPRWVKGAQARHVGGVVEIVVALSDDADFRAGNADGDDFINLFARAEAAPATPACGRRSRRNAPTRCRPTAWCRSSSPRSRARFSSASTGPIQPAPPCSGAARRSGWCSTPRPGWTSASCPSARRSTATSRPSRGPTTRRCASAPRRARRSTPTASARTGRSRWARGSRIRPT